MTISQKNLTTKIDVKINSPKGQDVFVKTPYYAPGNLIWLEVKGYIDGGYKFSEKATQEKIAEALVVNNTSEFGRGVRGQTMFVPRDHVAKFHKADFKFVEEPKGNK